ncbi:MAG: hypothetical protein ACRBBN_18725 [Methyloligellaceae bacterium]
MGLEYQHFLIPKDNSFRPSEQQVESLLAEWLKHGYLDRSCPAKYEVKKHHSPDFKMLKEENGTLPAKVKNMLDRKELLLRWEITFDENEILHYPLNSLPDHHPKETYYDLVLHFSDDFLYQCSEVINPFESTQCKCGVELEYYPEPEIDMFNSARIRRKCECGEMFKPQDHITLVRSGFGIGEGDQIKLAGGCTYRFAIVIDCQKCLPFTRSPHKKRDAFIRATRNFVSICENALDMELTDISDFY